MRPKMNSRFEGLKSSMQCFDSIVCWVDNTNLSFEQNFTKEYV